MISILRAILRAMFAAPLCPHTGKACPAPDRCGFYFTMTSCYAGNVELNREGQ